MRVELRAISKSFGRIRANVEINVKAEAGSIHAVLGENGAGKSTLMKILYGIYVPDSGEIFLNGNRFVWGSPRDAIRNRIGMVHQHFMLAGPFSALENIILGAEPCRGFLIDRRRARTHIDSLACQYGLSLDWDSSVDLFRSLPGERLEILKLLYRDADVLILDEPTSLLSAQERLSLFTRLHTLEIPVRPFFLLPINLAKLSLLQTTLQCFEQGESLGIFLRLLHPSSS